MKFLMLAALVASLVCLCWGDSTGDSLFSSNPPDPDSEFALEIAKSYISRVMFAPSEDLPKTYGSMTSPQDSTTTSTHEDLSPTDNGKLEPAQTSAKKSLEDQIDDLLAILRDIRSFIMPAYPGAGRIVIIISIFSMLQEQIGAACIITGGFAAQIRHLIDVGSPIHLF
ncbi:hypothetical protein H9Q69_014097 [Fusarium xylarioides]|nr:hypothetical protein H9Q69_014097 [Fusarium xylarioides]